MITLNTIAEIKAFQRQHKLVVDGIAGPQTRRALAEANRPVSQSARKEPDKKAINTSAVPVAASGKIAPLERLLGVDGVSRIKAMVDALPIDTARVIDEIIVHCAATPEGKEFDVRDVTAWHKQRGWSRCGYHFVIKRDGTPQVGSQIGQEGIHTKGHNKRTVGLSYIGGLTADAKVAKDTRTAEQTLCLYYLCRRIKARHKITKRVSGHNEYAQKACPSFKVATDPLGAL